MPRNSEEDWKKIREAERNLKDMPMSPEADQLDEYGWYAWTNPGNAT